MNKVNAYLSTGKRTCQIWWSVDVQQESKKKTKTENKYEKWANTNKTVIQNEISKALQF